MRYMQALVVTALVVATRSYAREFKCVDEAALLKINIQDAQEASRAGRVMILAVRRAGSDWGEAAAFVNVTSASDGDRIQFVAIKDMQTRIGDASKEIFDGIEIEDLRKAEVTIAYHEGMEDGHPFEGYFQVTKNSGERRTTEMDCSAREI